MSALGRSTLVTNKNKPVRLWAALIVGTLIALITQMPASALAWVVETISQQHVLLKDTRGSIWNGSGQWVLSSSSQRAESQIALDSRLNWHIQPTLEKWRPGLRIQMQSDCCLTTTNDLIASLSFNGIEISLDEHQSQWPASWLSGLGAPWNTMQPQGQIQIRLQRMAWSSAQPETFKGKAIITLKDLSTQLSTLKPLGSYQLEIAGSDTSTSNTPVVELKTIEGALLLSGQGRWINHRFQFDGQASARDDAQAALSNLLNVLGQRRGNSSILKMS
jgi:general secretion pathway protein N